MHNSGEAVVVIFGSRLARQGWNVGNAPINLAWRDLRTVPSGALRDRLVRVAAGRPGGRRRALRVCQTRSIACALPADSKLYVFRSVRNAAIDLAKTRSRRREEPLQPDWDGPDAAPATFDAEVSRLVADLLARLDDTSREVIELHLHAGLTLKRSPGCRRSHWQPWPRAIAER